MTEQTDDEINEVLARANRWVWTHDSELDTWWWIRKGGLSKETPDYCNDPVLMIELMIKYRISIEADAYDGQWGALIPAEGHGEFGHSPMFAAAKAAYQIVKGDA